MKFSKIKFALLAAGLIAAGGAQAAPVIGISPNGCGFGVGCSGVFYASLFTQYTDTAVATGDFTTPGAIGTFTTQNSISGTSRNGSPNTPAGLGVNTFEITEQIKFNEQVAAFTVTPAGATVQFQNTAQGPGANLTIFLDQLADGSQAVRSGPGGVSCYGAGAIPCANDGTAILTANIVSNKSSFTATSPGNGNGSFQVSFLITSFNPNFVDLSNLGGNMIVSTNFTGTLVQPATEANLGYTPPSAMFDGTPVAGNQLFKIDGSQAFGVVPEPSSVALLGLGIIGLALTRRRRTAKQAA